MLPMTEQATTLLTLDAKDLAILRELQTNAKLTVREIAARVHLSPTPVHERIKRLEHTGVIQRYVALVDRSRFEKVLTVFCHVSLKEHSRSIGAQFLERLQAMPAVTECYSVSGQYDFMLKVLVRDMDHYYHFHVHELGALEAIQQIQSVFVLGVVKGGVPA
jgi:DNA-binding Lrp family transcriptional regulator